MKKRILTAIILIAYGAFLVKVMVLKDLPALHIGHMILKFGGTQEGPANLLPFKTILPYLMGEKGWLIGGINLIGNIILLVPIGFLVPFVFRHMSGKKSLLLAIAAGLAIEGMQVLLRMGIFDIDDVILNGLGVMLGYWIYTMITSKERSLKTRNRMIAAVIVLAAIALLGGIAFYQQDQRPADRRQDVLPPLPDNSKTKDTVSVAQGEDPCNGTGGTGRILALGNNTITLKRRDSSQVLIHLTDQTTIKNSTGIVTQADLKTGDRVTIVGDSNPDGSMTVMTLLVCNASVSSR